MSSHPPISSSISSFLSRIPHRWRVLLTVHGIGAVVILTALKQRQNQSQHQQVAETTINSRINQMNKLKSSTQQTNTQQTAMKSTV